MRSLSLRIALGISASVIFIGLATSANAQTKPTPKRTNIEVILADQRICWIQETKDINGTWGESLLSDSKPRSITDIRSGLELPSYANPELVRSGNDLYLYPKSNDRDSTNSNLRYHRVPCPQPVANPDGIYLGLELIKTLSNETKTETVAATGAFSSEYKDSADPLGVGIVAGYDFAIPNSRWTIGPYASIDWLRMSVNHTFANGAWFGSTSNWFANLGGKLGYKVLPGWMIYGVGGASWINESLNLSFPAGFSTKTTTTPGAFAGFGTEFRPGWQVMGNPLALMVQYQHVWYDNATFNMPVPASPAFNYAFKREDDTVKFGVIMRFR